MKFVNRTYERNFMKEIVNDIISKQETCVWIEGSRGVGKSYFLKYVKENFDMPISFFSDHEWLFKCNESTIDNEFQLFVEIISRFQLNYPKEFNDFLVKYFQNIYDVSWVEALACIIPNIKYTQWAKELINYPFKQIETSKKQINNMLCNQGVKKCLAMIVLYFWKVIEKRDNIVLCIDDACWLDKNSIDTLKLLLNIIKYEEKEKIKLSLVILTRPINELNSEKQNYDILEILLKNIYEDLKYIRIKNFDYNATQEYISLMDKKYVHEITYNIFNVTNGNPQQLFQALKFNDYDLKKIAVTKNDRACSNYITAELLMKMMHNNSYALPILCSISLMQQKMQLSWLITILKSFCDQVLDERFNIIKFDNCLELLKTKDAIKIDINIVEIAHDSWKETAIEYIKNDGEYICYIDCVINSVTNKLPKNDMSIRECMHLYKESNPKQCFNMFAENYKKDSTYLEGNIIKFVAQSLSMEISLFTIDNIEQIIIPTVLERCVQLSYYELGYKICLNISHNKNKLKFEALYKYLIYFTKILIDTGKLQSKEKYNAIDSVDEIIICSSKLDSNMKIESYLIAMSAYEHILDFDNIKKYNLLAQKIINSNDIKNLYYAMYLRNQGLVKAHRDLNKEYLKAIEYSEGIENAYEKSLMLGTSYNNLGLCYLYNSDINEALQCFKNGQNYLDEIGYDTFRILNNIGICYILLGMHSQAYNYLLQAKALNTDCIFEKLCIQSNIAILEHKQGNYEMANNIIKPIIDEYQKDNKQTTDDLIYSSAMVNYAYFQFDNKNYWDALKWYKNSLFFKYRYDDDWQKKKREEMIQLCMYYCEIGPKSTYNNIDILDVDTNIFRKMYAPIPFAYYII